VENFEREKEKEKMGAPLGEVFFLKMLMFMLALILEMRKP